MRRLKNMITSVCQPLDAAFLKFHKKVRKNLWNLNAACILSINKKSINHEK